MDKTKIATKNINALVAAAFMVVFSVSPLAAFAGGISDANGGISTAQTVMYTFLGAGAAVYMLIKGFMLKINKIGWNDLFMALITCAVVAGLPALAVWFWDLGGS